MGTSTGPYPHASYHQAYYPSAAYPSPYYAPMAYLPMAGAAGHSEKEDRKRPSHIFPNKQSNQQSSSRKEVEQPIDYRFFHIEEKYVPVQIVDADKIRRAREEEEARARESAREERAREERAREARAREERAREARAREERSREGKRRSGWTRGNPSMREAWESTEYSSKVEYRNGTGHHHRDKHIYDHRRTTSTWISQNNPTYQTTHFFGPGTDKYSWTEEYVSRRKDYEVHPSEKGSSDAREQTSRAARPGPSKEYKWSKSYLRTRD